MTAARTVCDWVSVDCGDPTTTHVVVMAGHVKFACATHAGSIDRHPSVMVGSVVPLLSETMRLPGRTVAA